MSAERNTLIRRLALAKLRELRQAGLSYREIGQRYGAARGTGEIGAGGFEFRLSPERLLAPTLERTDAGERAAADHRVFLRALDALREGLAFFDLAATLLHANKALTRALEEDEAAERLRAEIRNFAESLGSLVRARARFPDVSEERVEELALRELRTATRDFRLQGSYMGLDLFGLGPTILITVQGSARPLLSEEALHERFGLTRQEGRIARLLAEGRSNAGIAAELGISPHTAQHHTTRVLAKLRVRSRAEVGHKLLRE